MTKRRNEDRIFLIFACRSPRANASVLHRFSGTLLFPSLFHIFSFSSRFSPPFCSVRVCMCMCGPRTFSLRYASVTAFLLHMFFFSLKIGCCCLYEGGVRRLCMIALAIHTIRVTDKHQNGTKSIHPSIEINVYFRIKVIIFMYADA